MINALAAAILALLVNGQGQYARHLREHALPPQQRAVQLAEYVDHAARVTNIPRPVLVALWYGESTLNPSAENKRTKAYGIGQILPGTRWFNDWTQDCARDPYVCELKGAEHSARALKHYSNVCGSLIRGLTAYRAGKDRETGKCLPPGPKAFATLRLAQRISFRLHIVSSAPLRAGGLP